MIVQYRTTLNSLHDAHTKEYTEQEQQFEGELEGVTTQAIRQTLLCAFMTVSENGWLVRVRVLAAAGEAPQAERLGGVRCGAEPPDQAGVLDGHARPAQHEPQHEPRGGLRHTREDARSDLTRSLGLTYLRSN